jgi:HAD superfamily hydrolase (TIGR01509 family)
MTIKAIFFDIDGTLVDSNEQHVLAWAEAFERVGASPDRQSIHQQIGKGADNLIPALMPDADEGLRERLAEAHGEIFKGKYLERIEPFPGARDLLARVRESGREVVLASSASAPELEHYLDLLDARDLVAETTSADDVAHTKPAPDIFASALDKVAPLEAGEVIVVGDTPYDMEAARKCGIEPIAVRSGKFSDDDLTRAGGRSIYDDVAALLAAFDESPIAR